MMGERTEWELVCCEEGDYFTRSTLRMEVEGGFLYREEINRRGMYITPFAAIALQFVPKPPDKPKVKVKRRKH
jgi:hypothetical protein